MDVQQVKFVLNLVSLIYVFLDGLSLPQLLIGCDHHAVHLVPLPRLLLNLPLHSSLVVCATVERRANPV